MISKVGPEGEEHNYYYDTNGNINRIVDPEQAETHYTYDYLNRLTEVEYPLGGKEHFSYDAFDRLIEVQDRKNGLTTFEYGALGSYIEVINPELEITRNEYDTVGRRIKRIGGRGEEVAYAYDPYLGNLSSVKGAEGEETRYTYDDYGYLESIIDIGETDRRVSGFTRDDYGRLTGKTGEEGYSIGYEYDYNRRLRKLIQKAADGDKVLREWEYDIDGALKREKYTLVNGEEATEYEYSLQGLLIKETNFRTQPIDYEYDLSGRLKEISYPTGEWDRFQYDRLGRIVEAETSEGSQVAYMYDADGNLIEEENLGEGERIAYTYNQADELIRIEGNSAGERIDYAYDAVGRIIELTAPEGERIGFSYDRSGNLTQAEYGTEERVISHYEYDLSSRMTGYRSIKRWGNHEELIDGFIYLYDRYGDIEYEMDREAYTTKYTYDKADRLQKAYYPVQRGWKNQYSVYERKELGLPVGEGEIEYIEGLPDVGETEAVLRERYDELFGDWKQKEIDLSSGPYHEETIYYDVFGRRNSKVNEFGSIEYSYDTQDRLIGAGNKLYGYDADGNRVAETSEADTADIEYTYRADNRMTGYLHSDGDNLTYRYDPLGRRIEKELTESANPGNDIRRLNRTQYLGLSHSVLFEEAETQNHKTSIKSLWHYLGPGGRSYGSREDSAGNCNKPVTSYYHYDIRGSITAVSHDKPGLSGESLYYGPFGELLDGGQGIGFEYNNGQYEGFTNIAFTGKRIDLETGLYHFPYREYDSLVAQWTTEDPIKDGEFWYAFCSQNPVKYLDPLGLQDDHGYGKCDAESSRAAKHGHNLYIYTEDNFGIPGWIEALGEAFKAGDFIFDHGKKEIIQVNPNARLVKVSSDIEFCEAVMEFARDTGNRIDLLNVTSHSVPRQLVMNFDSPKELCGQKINYVDITDFEYLKDQGIGITRTHFSGCSTAGYVELPFINIVQAVSELFQAVSTGYTTGTASSLISGFEYKEGEYVRVRMEDVEFVYDTEGYILQYLFADELREYSNGEIVSRRTRGKRRWHEQLEE